MNLRKIRKERNLSVPQLVELSGVPRRTIQDIEKRGDCKVSTAIKLAIGLGITLEELFDFEKIKGGIEIMKNLVGKEITLGELSGELLKTEKFEDIFDFDIDRDVLDSPEENKGSFADIEGDIIVYFDVIEREDNDLETIVKVTSVDGL